MIILGNPIEFPPVQYFSEDGIVAIGGNLFPETLLKAYRLGIFPWYNEAEPIIWWCPDPRCVLFPPELKISKSMQVVLRKQNFKFTTNQSFVQVLENCRAVNLQKHDGTWISDNIIDAYHQLYQLGYAHSAEAWLNNELVGGLYGIRIGNVFFGESMFSKVSNASKFAFIKYVQLLQNSGVVLVDCQMYTSHLQSLGATMINRALFLRLLKENC